MQLKDLDFSYPEHLIATERVARSRVMLVRGSAQNSMSGSASGSAPGSDPEPEELASVADLKPLFQPGDLLVLNDTRVLKRRVFASNGLEILFLKNLGSDNLSRPRWEVLFPSSRLKDGVWLDLPAGKKLRLVSRGRPQTVEINEPLTEDYFLAHAELPLPPYIQKARGERHNRTQDQDSYQTAWAAEPGSLAAPTASFHFSHQDLEDLKESGVKVAFLTLHVGLGTFLPITTTNLDEHPMHTEEVEVPAATWAQVQETRKNGRRVWALGTTVTRALESAALGLLPPQPEGGFRGGTDLFIRPGFKFQSVDALMTNFHQPESTLLALVAAFAGLETVKRSYQWAIEKEFRLFSYGDLTVWLKQ